MNSNLNLAKSFIILIVREWNTGNHSPVTGPAKNFCRASYRVHLEFPPQRSNLNLQCQLQGFSRANASVIFKSLQKLTFNGVNLQPYLLGLNIIGSNSSQVLLIFQNILNIVRLSQRKGATPPLLGDMTTIFYALPKVNKKKLLIIKGEC